MPSQSMYSRPTVERDLTPPALASCNPCLRPRFPTKPRAAYQHGLLIEDCTPLHLQIVQIAAHIRVDYNDPFHPKTRPGHGYSKGASLPSPSLSHVDHAPSGYPRDLEPIGKGQPRDYLLAAIRAFIWRPGCFEEALSEDLRFKGRALGLEKEPSSESLEGKWPIILVNLYGLWELFPGLFGMKPWYRTYGV